ncbi:MAG: riboflavin kinase, partial [Chitinophagaceae bacterium]
REQNIAINESSAGSIFHPLTESLKGMMNIGMRPTINGSKKTIEVHIFNFTEDIYGKTLEVTVKTFLRMEQKFNGLESLKIQLDEDKKNSLYILSRL